MGGGGGQQPDRALRFLNGCTGVSLGPKMIFVCFWKENRSIILWKSHFKKSPICSRNTAVFIFTYYIPFQVLEYFLTYFHDCSHMTCIILCIVYSVFIHANFHLQLWFLFDFLLWKVWDIHKSRRNSKTNPSSTVTHSWPDGVHLHTPASPPTNWSHLKQKSPFMWVPL